MPFLLPSLQPSLKDSHFSRAAAPRQSQKLPPKQKDVLGVDRDRDPLHNDYPSSRACHQVYDNLIFLNDDGSFRPGLAEKWEFVSDTA